MPGAEIDDIGAAAIGLALQIFFRTKEETAVVARQILLAEDIDRRKDMPPVELLAEAGVRAIALAAAILGVR